MSCYFPLVLIGLVMGLFGGLLGIGGSVVMIPALVLVFGENQHLYQASAMICNFFVAASATFAHKRQKMLTGSVIRYLIPTSVAGVVLGVFASNAPLFSGSQSYLLARLFGLFLLYVIYYNVVRLYRDFSPQLSDSRGHLRNSSLLSSVVGLITGFAAGLLGIGGGAICVPLQQVLLKMPLKKAIANSAATIILIAAVGATLKNATLYRHEIAIFESVRIAAVVIPWAFIAGFAGARIMHILPKKYVRVAFILLLILASYKMLTA